MFDKIIAVKYNCASAIIKEGLWVIVYRGVIGWGVCPSNNMEKNYYISHVS